MTSHFTNILNANSVFLFNSDLRHKTKKWLFFTHFKRFIDRKWVAFGNVKAKNVTYGVIALRVM